MSTTLAIEVVDPTIYMPCEFLIYDELTDEGTADGGMHAEMGSSKQHRINITQIGVDMEYNNNTVNVRIDGSLARDYAAIDFASVPNPRGGGIRSPFHYMDHCIFHNASDVNKGTLISMFCPTYSFLNLETVNAGSIDMNCVSTPTGSNPYTIGSYYVKVLTGTPSISGDDIIITGNTINFIGYGDSSAFSTVDVSDMDNHGVFTNPPTGTIDVIRQTTTFLLNTPSMIQTYCPENQANSDWDYESTIAYGRDGDDYSSTFGLGLLYAITGGAAYHYTQLYLSDQIQNGRNIGLYNFRRLTTNAVDHYNTNNLRMRFYLAEGTITLTDLSIGNHHSYVCASGGTGWNSSRHFTAQNGSLVWSYYDPSGLFAESKEGRGINLWEWASGGVHHRIDKGSLDLSYDYAEFAGSLTILDGHYIIGSNNISVTEGTRIEHFVDYAECEKTDDGVTWTTVSWEEGYGYNDLHVGYGSLSTGLASIYGDYRLNTVAGYAGTTIKIADYDSGGSYDLLGLNRMQASPTLLAINDTQIWNFFIAVDNGKVLDRDDHFTTHHSIDINKVSTGVIDADALEITFSGYNDYVVDNARIMNTITEYAITSGFEPKFVILQEDSFYIHTGGVICSPTSIDAGVGSTTLRVYFHDDDDLGVSGYTIDFWVRDPDGDTLGAYSASTIIKDDTYEYHADYVLSPPGGWDIGTYDLKAMIDTV